MAAPSRSHPHQRPHIASFYLIFCGGTLRLAGADGGGHIFAPGRGHRHDWGGSAPPGLCRRCRAIPQVGRFPLRRRSLTEQPTLSLNPKGPAWREWPLVGRACGGQPAGALTKFLAFAGVSLAAQSSSNPCRQGASGFPKKSSKNFRKKLDKLFGGCYSSKAR